MALSSETLIEYVQKILLRCDSDKDNVFVYKGKENNDELDYIVCAICLLGRSSKITLIIPTEMFGDDKIKEQVRSVKTLLKYRKLVE